MLVTLLLRRLGPDLESIIAGKGACSHQYSQEHHTSVVNIDIGGDSNLAVFREGDVIDTGVLDIGRVGWIKMDPPDPADSYIAPKLQTIIAEQGFSWQLVKQSIELIWISPDSRNGLQY